jgi:hypothetical protein
MRAFSGGSALLVPEISISLSFEGVPERKPYSPVDARLEHSARFISSVRESRDRTMIRRPSLGDANRTAVES